MKYLLNQKYTNGSFQQMHQIKKETKRGNKTNQIIKKSRLLPVSLYRCATQIRDITK